MAGLDTTHHDEMLGREAAGVPAPQATRLSKVCVGVEDNWAKAFEGIYTEPPRWYTGPAGVHTFRPSTFTSNLGVMSTRAASVMASAPRSSGGSGFGGGFGGGGGGGF